MFFFKEVQSIHQQLQTKNLKMSKHTYTKNKWTSKYKKVYSPFFNWCQFILNYVCFFFNLLLMPLKPFNLRSQLIIFIFVNLAKNLAGIKIETYVILFHLIYKTEGSLLGTSIIEEYQQTWLQEHVGTYIRYLSHYCKVMYKWIFYRMSKCSRMPYSSRFANINVRENMFFSSTSIITKNNIQCMG